MLIYTFCQYCDIEIFVPEETAALGPCARREAAPRINADRLA